ncbi:MAG TPA: hypothetical protein VGD99_14695, partial [Anaerolineae bacterium]
QITCFNRFSLAPPNSFGGARPAGYMPEITESSHYIQDVTINHIPICGVTDLEIFNYAIDFFPVKGNAKTSV